MKSQLNTLDGSGDLSAVAGGGLLDRRLFLKRSLNFATAATLAAIYEEPLADTSSSAKPRSMLTPGKPFSNYGSPSLHEADAIRWISANPVAAQNGVSWTPLHKLEGTITPNGLHFERHHNGVPSIDPGQHRLLIHGRVKRPLFFEVEDLLRYPMQSKICFLECGGNSNAGWREEPIQTPVGYFHGLVSCSEWTGVPLAILLDEAGIRSQATWVIAEGADGIAMNISLPVSKAMDDVIVALYQNGERIRPENGYPLRLIVPGWEGVLNVKWLRRINITDQPIMARNETSKYTELLPNGKARQFTFVMEAKSIITNPSFGMKLKDPGLYQISGLAWTGGGRISRVEVSADGGKSWAQSLLQEPVLATNFTRFRIPWRWNGEPTILKSRAVDSTGYQQPERDKLIAERGRHGYFHYNGIVSWSVSEEGEIRHVYA